MAVMDDVEARAWASLQRGDLESARRISREILRNHPASARVWYLLGAAEQLDGQLEEAEACYRSALQLDPGLAQAWNNLGLVRMGFGATTEAILNYRQALQLNPEAPDAHNNLGNALHELGELRDAVDHYREALRLSPRHADAHHNLGNVFRSLGRLDEALDSYDQALRLRPDHPETRLSRALLLIQMGDYERGWAEYEWRWRCDGYTLPRFAQPSWDGAPLAGRTILLYADHGLGDTLQFVRYAPIIERLGGRVIVACQRPVAGLLASCPGVERVVAEGDALPAFDVYAPLMSLPRLCRTTVSTVPAEVPYLHPDPGRVNFWRHELGAGGELKVGIVWQGNRRYRRDQQRSFPLALLAPLARIAGVRLISLQNGAAAEQIDALDGAFEVTDIGNRLDSFQEIAAVVRTLDLVIAADSAVGHLAGALGIPTWLALPFAPDFRWLAGRDDSPWYPHHRLFRQQRWGSWDELFERMATALSRFSWFS